MHIYQLGHLVSNSYDAKSELVYSWTWMIQLYIYITHSNIQMLLYIYQQNQLVFNDNHYVDPNYWES